MFSINVCVHIRGIDFIGNMSQKIDFDICYPWDRTSVKTRKGSAWFESDDNQKMIKVEKCKKTKK